MNENILESIDADLTHWEIGPFHSAIPQPIKLKMTIDGEVIVACEYETGFVHRGLEKALELTRWNATVAYADRLSAGDAFFSELVTCMAIEDLANIEVPERAQGIRVILCELSRVSSHLEYIVRMARAVGSETVVHYVLRDREKILDIFELLAGSRFSPNFLKCGGVVGDISEGFIDRVLEICEMIQMRMKEYNDLFSFNQSFLKRTAGIGVLSPQDAVKWGVSGSNARASGLSFDVRKSHVYCGYNNYDFSVPTGAGEFGAPGDCHDRYLVRMREVTESLQLIKQVAEELESGPFQNEKVGDDFKIKSGEAYSRVESSRGMLGCYIHSDGGLRPSRIQYRPPSSAHVACLPGVLKGANIEDLPVIFASLNISMAEVDR